MTGLASTAGLFAGEPVSGIGIAAGTTITQINSSSQITLSQAATSTGPSSLTFIGDDPALNGTMVLNSNLVTGLSSTAGLYVDEPVVVPGISTTTLITAIDSSSEITLNQAAPLYLTASLTFLDDETIADAMLTSGSTTATGLVSTSGFYLGEPVSGTGIPLDTTVAAINSATSITLSQAARSSESSNLTFLSDVRTLTGTLSATTSVAGLPSTLGLSEGEDVFGAASRRGRPSPRSTRPRRSP